MKKKILFISSIDKHILRFHLPWIKWFAEQGYEVHVACKGDGPIPLCSKVHPIDFERSPLSFRHFKALFQLRKLYRDEKFSIIHCNTSIASILGRFASILHADVSSKQIISISHGFHFFKDGPLINWLLYFPIEFIASFFQHALITINREDYQIAKRFFLCKRVFHVPGMGVSKEKFNLAVTADKLSLRAELSIHPEARVLIYTAEFIKRKNHAFIIRSVRQLSAVVPNLIIIFPGRGKWYLQCKQMVSDLGLQDIVLFPGFVPNIEKYIAASDICVSASKQEGLGLHIVECMMLGLPVVATKTSGHRDLVNHDVNGFLYNINDADAFINYVAKLFNDNALYRTMQQSALKKAAEFEFGQSYKAFIRIYKEIFGSC